MHLFKIIVIYLIAVCDPYKELQVIHVKGKKILHKCKNEQHDHNRLILDCNTFQGRFEDCL